MYRVELAFNVIVLNEPDDRLAPAVHAALLEFVEFNRNGDWPRGKGYQTKNRVWVKWDVVAGEGQAPA